MNNSINNGTSGLLSFQKALDIESNNIANASTVGFKSDTISFADMMYQNGIGKGVTMLDPVKNFQQGSVKPTGMDYDFAIDGEGFFTLNNPLNPDNAYYTRAGNFHRSSEGYLVDASDMFVMGVLPVVSGDKITEEFTKNIASSIVENETSIVSINTYATNYSASATNTGVSGTNYKTASANINDIEALKVAYQSSLLAYEKNMEVGTPATQHIDTVVFSTVMPASGEYTLEITIDGNKFQQQFDTSIENTLNLFSDKINQYTGLTSSVDTATGALTIESIIPGQKITSYNALLNDNTSLINTLSIEAGSGQNLVDAIYAKLESIVVANGGQLATNRSEITKTTTGTEPVFGAIMLDLDTLGISDNMFGELENDNGNLYLTQENGRYLVGRLDTVVFVDNGGLKPEGSNLYTSTANSGEALYMAGSADILNGFVEVSTVDLSEGLVNLMVWQKAFEANSKSVTTSDELLKTALQLKAR